MDKLTDLEIEQLRRFWENSDMREAVFKTLNQEFVIVPDSKLNDEEIGQRTRAIWQARSIVQTAFNDIEKLTLKVEIPITKLNQAR